MKLKMILLTFEEEKQQRLRMHPINVCQVELVWTNQPLHVDKDPEAESVLENDMEAVTIYAKNENEDRTVTVTVIMKANVMGNNLQILLHILSHVLRKHLHEKDTGVMIS